MVSMRIQMSYAPGQDIRFSRQAISGMVGQEVPISHLRGGHTIGTVTRAEITQGDQTAVTIEVTIDDESRLASFMRKASLGAEVYRVGAFGFALQDWQPEIIGQDEWEWESRSRE